MRILYNDKKLYLSLSRSEQELIHCDYEDKCTQPLELPMSYLHVLHQDISNIIHTRYKELDEKYRPEAYVIEGRKKTNN